jgi:hypothetical protein
MGTFCAVDVDVDVEGKMGITPDLRTDSDCASVTNPRAWTA